jgi:hypothetical protein
MATTYGGERDASTTFARNATPAPAPETKTDVTGFPAKGTVLGYRYLGGLDATKATMRYAKVADGNGGVTETLQDNPEYKTAATQAQQSGAYATTLASNVAAASVRKLVKTVNNGDGTFTNTYDNGTTDVTGTKITSGGSGTGGSGTVIAPKTAEQLAAEAIAAGKTADRKSAYDLLYEQFNKYGLSSLVEPLKGLITDPGVSPSEFTIKLRETEPYKQRFGANTQRIAKGLRSLNEAEYIGLEDQYQNIMRNYGLPDTYYTKGDLGRQPGFEKFIAGDVSPVELESRIQTAQNRVVKANPEVSAALKQFYPDISSGDILAYVLDPTNALENIKRKVSAAEIGGAALQQGLQTGVARAEQLASYGITKQMAEQGYGTIGGGLQRGSELSSIYGQPAYDQKTAEQEVFNLAGGTEAARERKKLTSLERATFGGTTGMTSSALSRERAGQY